MVTAGDASDEAGAAVLLYTSELKEVHLQLVQSARRAGMAEIATNVLHNVGNVLNSVNVSATLVIDQMRNSKLANLSTRAFVSTGDNLVIAPYATYLALPFAPATFDPPSPRGDHAGTVSASSSRGTCATVARSSTTWEQSIRSPRRT